MNINHNILRICVGLLFSIVSFTCAIGQSLGSTLTRSSNLLLPDTVNTTICNNQLPYHWNGLTCLNAGTYAATLTGSTGADSVVILHLTVINVGTSITNAIVCNNQLPYRWNGNSYSSSGTYSVTLTSSSGCDSVPILSLTVNDVVTSTTSRSVCISQLPYSWNGNSYSAGGSYNVTLRSAAGCDSIATLHLTVKNVSTSTTSVSICSNQLPYHWNGNSYPAAGTYLDTLVSGNGCDSVATLNLVTRPTSGSNTAVTICNNELPYHWNGRTYAAAGSYPVIFTGASGCDSIAVLNLTVGPPISTITHDTICAGQLPYSWNGNSYNAAGIFPVTLTSANGCDSIAKLHLLVVPFVTSHSIQRVCVSNLPFTWNGNNYATAGTYTANLSSPSGCDSVATLDLIIDSVQDSELDLIICSNQLPFNWNGHVCTDSGSYNLVPPVSNGGCDMISILKLQILPVLPGTTTASVCNNNLPYVWNGRNYTATGIYSTHLTSISGCDSIANLNLTVNPVTTSITNITACSNQLPYTWNGHNYSTGGTYTVNLTSTAGCDSVATLKLQVSPVRTSTTQLNICNAQLPYHWNGNNYTSGGTYAVTLISAGGCDSIATLQLTVSAVLTSTTLVSICNNQLPYSWNGNSYTVSGTYSDTLLSQGGCDSVATLQLMANPVITSSTNINICNTQLPYRWNGNNYTASGSYSISLVSMSGCDSVATLNLAVNAAVSSTTTTTICNNQLPYSWNGNSYPAAGTYPVTLTSTSGCDSVATLHLVVTDILTSNTNVTVCNSQLPYQWNGNNYPAGGTYSVILTTAAGCDSVPILSLTIVPFVTSTTHVTACNNNLPYHWNGNNYNAPGTYTVTLTAFSGCDSIATLNLDIANTVTSTTNLSICSTQLPYRWNGNSYPAAGTYTVTLTGSSGCDSVASLHLFVNPQVSSITDLTVCNSQLPFNWNGHAYTAPGNYSVTLQSAAGCDSVATLHLMVDVVTRSTSNIAVCNNQLPYLWNGQSYLTAGTYSVTLTGSGGCDSVATLKLAVNPVVRSSSTISTCMNQLPYHWNGHNYTTAGVHDVTLTSAAGCDSVASLNLIIFPETSSFSIISTCDNQLPYNWNGQSLSGPGTYQVTLTGIAGCDSVATLDLRVNPVKESNTNVIICSTRLPFAWNGNNYTSAGDYSIILTSSAGCDSVARLHLTVNPTPGLPVVSTPVAYCQYEQTDSVTAHVTEPGNQLLWYDSATGGVGSLHAPVPSAGHEGVTHYYVSQYNGSCESPRAMVTVTINAKPDLGLDKTLKICFGQATDLSLLYHPVGNTVNWTYNNLPVPDFRSVTVGGDYQLISNNTFGCGDTAVVKLIIQPELIANAGEDADAEYNAPYQLNGSGGGQYQWFPSNLLNNSFIANPLTTLSNDAIFILKVKDEIGCFALDTVKIRVLKGPTFYVPSAFTPNGDGQNDIFRPTAVGIKNLDYFRIFNRYGELVFETRQIGKGWDGYYKGIKQNPGNYVWSLQGTDRTGTVKLMRGNVVLIR